LIAAMALLLRSKYNHAYIANLTFYFNIMKGVDKLSLY